jgi:rubrerythrin
MASTQDNLMAAFAGESQARNMYTFYAKVARKEGYHYIAKIFEETAANEQRHAKDEFTLAGRLGDTAANLRAAISGEDHETRSMYPEFAAQAQAEGNREAALLFQMIAKIEAEHRNRYAKLLEMVVSGTVWKRDRPIRWKCSVCGYIHEGTEPPGKCPCCAHERQYFEPESLEL